jgi:SAM-dependent methyltransferase
VAEDWFRTFFDRAANDHWNAAVPIEHTTEEVEFLVERLGVVAGDHALDVAAGRGRVSLPMADRGVRVTAVDISDDGTRGLQAARGARPIAVVRADMRGLPFRAGFAGAWCLGNSFGYFPVDGVECFLAEVARVLCPGAVFVLESATVREALEASFAERTEHDFGGVRVVGRHHLEGDRLVSDLEVDDGTGVRGVTIEQLSLPSDRIAELVDSVGLQVDELLGDLTGEPFDASARSLLMVARLRS